MFNEILSIKINMFIANISFYGGCCSQVLRGKLHVTVAERLENKDSKRKNSHAHPRSLAIGKTL